MAKNASEPDALTLLHKDHERVKEAFEEFEQLGDQAYSSMRSMADSICQDLEKHSKIEEEIFYPAFQKAVKDAKAMVNEAVVEHNTAKDLIKQIRSMDPKDSLFAAKVKVLGEYVNHHVQEEENEMFPLMKKAKIDLNEMGEQMAARKQELA